MTTSPPTPKPSVLAEASPASLEDYFNKDPLELTRQDRDVIVEYFRKARETFLREEAEGKKPGRRAVAAKSAPKQDLPPDFKLDLGDL